jgi:hypothetical protein
VPLSLGRSGRFQTLKRSDRFKALSTTTKKRFKPLTPGNQASVVKVTKGSVTSSRRRWFPTLSEEVVKQFEGKDLCNGWCSIREAFGDLYQKLDQSNEMDKAVKYILDSNLNIRALDAKYNSFSSTRSNSKLPELAELAKTNPKIQFGRFRPGKGGEDEIIKKNWEKLVRGADIKDPTGCLRQFQQMSRKNCSDSSLLRKRNVLGCYLNQKLPYIRFCLTVYYRGEIILLPWNQGLFTPEEDALILKKVNENGEALSTMKELATLLNKQRPDLIRERYRKIKFPRNNNIWTMQENKLFLENFFAGKKESAEKIIPSISMHHCISLEEHISRSRHHIYKHWANILKPVLLSFHAGELHYNWKKPFLEEIKRQKIVKIQDINWNYFQALYPNQTTHSMDLCIHQSLRGTNSGEPIYKRLAEILPTLKNKKELLSVTRRREEIAALYDQIRFSN